MPGTYLFLMALSERALTFQSNIGALLSGPHINRATQDTSMGPLRGDTLTNIIADDWEIVHCTLVLVLLKLEHLG